MFRRVSLLIITIALLLAGYVWGAQSVSKAAAASVRQWEYASVLILSGVNSGSVTVPDAKEQQQLMDALGKIPAEQFGGITILNIMGESGWEWIDEQHNESFSTYTFKRPKV